MRHSFSIIIYIIISVIFIITDVIITIMYIELICITYFPTASFPVNKRKVSKDVSASIITLKFGTYC